MKIYPEYLSLLMAMSEWQCDQDAIYQMVKFDRLKIHAKVGNTPVYEWEECEPIVTRSITQDGKSVTQCEYPNQLELTTDSTGYEELLHDDALEVLENDESIVFEIVSNKQGYKRCLDEEVKIKTNALFIKKDEFINNTNHSIQPIALTRSAIKHHYSNIQSHGWEKRFQSENKNGLAMAKIPNSSPTRYDLKKLHMWLFDNGYYTVNELIAIEKQIRLLFN